MDYLLLLISIVHVCELFTICWLLVYTMELVDVARRYLLIKENQNRDSRL